MLCCKMQRRRFNNTCHRRTKKANFIHVIECFFRRFGNQAKFASPSSKYSNPLIFILLLIFIIFFSSFSIFCRHNLPFLSFFSSSFFSSSSSFLPFIQSIPPSSCHLPQTKELTAAHGGEAGGFGREEEHSSEVLHAAAQTTG